MPKIAPLACVEELHETRELLLSLLPPPLNDLLKPPLCTDWWEADAWRRSVVPQIVELAQPMRPAVESMGFRAAARALCPLCRGDSETIVSGYSLPDGLKRHLLGTHSSRECEVMRAAKLLALRRVV